MIPRNGNIISQKARNGIRSVIAVSLLTHRADVAARLFASDALSFMARNVLRAMSGVMINSSKSKIIWSSVFPICIKSIQRNEREDGKEYWLIRSYDGLIFSCFSSRIAEKIVAGEDIKIEGEVRFGRGSTYLVVKKIIRGALPEMVEEEKDLSPL
jgi:hypothetical protein